MKNSRSLLIVSLIFFACSVGAAAQVSEPRSHMLIADPATLSGTRAEGVYQSIRSTMSEHYFESGDPITSVYQSWKRYNTVPYRSSLHGGIFVNHYANSIARRYGRFEKLGHLPQGALVIKDSFIVTGNGAVITGPLFLMEKKEPGFNATSKDWLFMTIRADGSLEGITNGQGAKNVEYCAACHNNAPDGQDSLFFLPKEIRQRH